MYHYGSQLYHFVKICTNHNLKAYFQCQSLNLVNISTHYFNKKLYPCPKGKSCYTLKKITFSDILSLFICITELRKRFFPSFSVSFRLA